jgi:hypothetical protein
MTNSRSAQPGSYALSGPGAAAGGEPPGAPGSGKASVQPNRPGAASWAGWSPPPAGEAAPPVRLRGPVRSDGTPGRPAPRDLRWPSLGQPGPRHIPVVGPTEAVGPRRDPAPPLPVPDSSAGAPGQSRWPQGGRGGNRPPGADHGLSAVERQSGWQLAQQVWQDSGVDWEAAPAGTPAEADLYAVDPYAPAAFAAPFATDPSVRDPFAPGQPAADQYGSDGYGAGRYGSDQAGSGPPGSAQADPSRPATGPRGSLQYEPAEPAPASPARVPSFTPVAFTPVAFAGPRSFGTVPLGAPVAPVAPPAPAPPPAPAAAPLTESDELFRAWQGSVRAAAAGPVPWAGRRPDGGRRAAPARRRPAAGRRGRGWPVVKVGVPAAVIVTVGAGALLMLTGRANEMLAPRANPGAVSSAAPGVSASLSPVTATLSGYPGGHGNVSVTALWSASGVTVAAGYADGHPAVWRLGPSGHWALVSAAVFGGLTGHLTSVVQGPQGWIAVGSVAVNGTPEPVVYHSADGMTWSPLSALTSLAGSGAQFLGVAAGPGGYLVVGRQGAGPQTAAALWWSGNLTSWSNGGNSGNTGSLAAGAVAVGDGFIAVGSEHNCHTIWTSPDGRHWTAHDLAKPEGAHAATLRSVVASASGRIVAAGFATNNTGNIPLVVASAADGTQLTQVVLDAPDGPATVTAVTATGTGFVAAGLSGPANAQRAVTWTSKNGLTWSAATPVTAAGAGQITALTATSTAGPGPVVTGTAQRGASPVLLTVPAP